MGVAQEKLQADSPLYLSQTESEEVYTRQFSGGLCCAFTFRSPLSEGPNQDGLLLQVTSPKEGVIAVADGVGGSKAGHEASRIALQAVSEEVSRAKSQEVSLRSCIVDGFERANREVMALGVGAATTLIVVELSEGSIRSYHAGDSFVLLVGQRGKQKYQTIDHTPVGYALEAGIVADEEAMTHSERHIVTNVIGFEDMRLDIGPRIQMQPRDTIVVGSDGVSDNLSLDEITDTIRVGRLEKCAQSLKERSQTVMNGEAVESYGKPDDLTFVLFRRGV